MTSPPPLRERDREAAESWPDDRHPVSSYLHHLGPGSRRTMSGAIEKLARLASDGRWGSRSLPWHALRVEHTRALRRRLAETMAPATANKHLAALRGVLKEASKLGLMSAEDYRRATDWRPVHGEAPRPSRALTPDELRALWAACERDRSPAGARDSALLALLCGAGLRRSEVVAIDLADYDPSTGTLAVAGGGGRRRRLLADSEARDALETWLRRRGDEPGPLFNPINKGGRLQLRRLSEQAIYVACRKRAAEAGLSPVSPEDLRRTLLESRRRRMRRTRRRPEGAGRALSAGPS